MVMVKLHRSFAKVPLHWQVERNVPQVIKTALAGLEQIIANGLTNRCHCDVVIARCVCLTNTPALQLQVLCPR